MRYYIVKRNNEYYVKYKDKISDEYSKHWIEAKRYKKISGALNRLGIFSQSYVYAKELLDKKNSNKQVLRKKKIANLSDSSYSEILKNFNFFENGIGIEIVDIDDNDRTQITHHKSCEIVNGDINEHLMKIIKPFEEKYKRHREETEKHLKQQNIKIIDDPNDDFWDL